MQTRILCPQPPAAALRTRQGMPPARPLHLLLILLTLGAPAAAQPPPGWLAELDEPFRLYHAGRYDDARDRAEQLARRAADPRLRDEATALAAMALLRSDARDDRLAGRRMLLRLAAHNPELTRRPDVRLALGIGLTALYETAAAIQELHAAVEGFERQGRSTQQLEALVALARAWAVHGEWEVPLPGVAEPIPPDAAGREQLRRTMIQRCRTQAARLPDSHDAVSRIDLILADRLLQSNRTRADGLRILEQLARSLEGTPAAARACLRLAGIYESQQRWDDALRQLDRVRRSGSPLADEAQRRYVALTEPRIEVTAPESLRPGEPLSAHLRLRNVQQVQVEARRVDLAALLARDHGRILEAKLPEAGSRVAAGTWPAPSDAGRRWWPLNLAEDKSWRLPVGSYALIVRARDARGRSAITRRLLVVSDLDAAIWMGTRKAALCSRWTTTAPDPHEPVSAEFWAAGAFVPRRINLTGGAALFDLPGDLRALGAARFSVLVRSGPHVALLRGTTTPAQRSRHLPPRVAVTFAPPQPRAGTLMQVFGTQIDPPDAPPPEQPLRIELRDAEQRLVAESPATRHGRTFMGTLAIPRGMRAASLRLHVRLGSQTLPIADGPVLVRITPADVPDWSVALTVPAHLRPKDKSLHGVLAARYPWGLPLADARGHLTIRALALPTAGRDGLRIGGPLSEDRGRLDALGTYEFALPLARLFDHSPPIGLSLTGGVTGFDGRHVDLPRDLLVARTPRVAWIETPAEPARVGQPLRLAVAWFDPTGRLGTLPVRLTVRDPAGRVLMLPLRAEPDALRSEPWRPAQPGRHEVVARFGSDPDALTVRRTIPVQGRARSADIELLSVVRAADEPAARVRLHTATAGQAVLLIADREPRWIGNVRLSAGEQTLNLPWPRPAGPTAKLILAGWDADGLHVLASRPVESAAAATLTVRAPAQAAPGTTLTADLHAARGTLPDDTVLIARVTDANDVLAVPWLPGVRRERDESAPRLELFDSRRPTARDVVTGRLPIVWHDLLYRGASQRIEDLAMIGQQRLFVSLPEQPGLWELSLWAVHEGWIIAHTQTRIDTRRMPRAEVSLPELWSPGDRVRLAAELHNPLDQPLDATLRIDPGRRLAVEPESLTRGTPVRLAAGRRRYVPLTIEAAGPGRGLFRWALETGQQTGTRQSTMRVLPDPPPPAADAPIRIERRVYVIRVEGPQTAEELEPPAAGTAANWTRERLGPNDRVPPGTRLLVSDRWIARDDLADVSLVQYVPPLATTCRLTSNERAARSALAEPAVRTLQTLEWELDRLPGGEYVHEFVIATIAGGVARLRPPVVRLAGQPVPLAIEPPEFRLHVSAPPPGAQP